MVFKVNFSDEGADDLDEIIRYISVELCNPKAAENFYNEVDEKIELLREHPYIFPLYPDEKLNAEGYRYAIIRNFLMFYLVDDEISVVTIARILYGKRDIPSAFDDSDT